MFYANFLAGFTAIYNIRYKICLLFLNNLNFAKYFLNDLALL